MYAEVSERATLITSLRPGFYWPISTWSQSETRFGFETFTCKFGHANKNKDGRKCL